MKQQDSICMVDFRGNEFLFTNSFLLFRTSRWIRPPRTQGIETIVVNIFKIASKLSSTGNQHESRNRFKETTLRLVATVRKHSRQAESACAITWWQIHLVDAVCYPKGGLGGKCWYKPLLTFRQLLGKSWLYNKVAWATNAHLVLLAEYQFHVFLLVQSLFYSQYTFIRVWFWQIWSSIKPLPIVINNTQSLHENFVGCRSGTE